MKTTKNLKAEFWKMRLQGISQKEIAGKIGMTEKTISRWAIDLPQSKAAKTLKKLQDRLLKEACTLTIEEIVKISDAMVKLHKIASSTKGTY